MNVIPQSEKLAVLLNLLDNEATEAALSGVQPEAARQVKATLEEFKSHPPTQQETEFVVDDFVRYFRFAMQTVETKLEQEEEQQNKDGEVANTILQLAEEDFEVDIEPEKKFVQPSLTGNVLHDLNRMHPYQVAQAIRNEQTRTISLLIRNLTTEHAAKTLELLPESIRPAVFLHLAQPATVADSVVENVLNSTLENAMKVEKRQPIEDTADQMVALIRSVPKSIRIPMLEELIRTDEELGNKVKSQLYRFEDLADLSDRDLQQVLGKTDTDSLVVSLTGADEELVEKILGNMSKRARVALQEEMEFKTGVKADEVALGRKEIVKVIVELEESGAISLE